MNVDWDELANRYTQLANVERATHANLAAIKGILGQASSALPRDTAVALAWFEGALTDAPKKWFVAKVMENTNPVPRSLLDPLLKAALKEPNPSANRLFLEPCIRTFGPQTVRARICELANAPDAEYGDGLSHAMYWINGNR
ncbi:hypothetical protein G3O06_26720 [Burkholderia sp. Ac-20345]|uniref:hypothetical protein n=1 Tax=Burkholderia TaxID=32008 RepID=UPI0014534362|nr:MULTISPECIES: hypothetical protein [Burkholderia]MBN3781109.1 hypothetical protein [Burkholderia sp. Ac-20345]VWC28550.1 hypothetical protein BLA14095_06166 [Burkholderia lata]